jgi:hypothetical protein
VPWRLRGTSKVSGSRCVAVSALQQQITSTGRCIHGEPWLACCTGLARAGDVSSICVGAVDVYDESKHCVVSQSALIGRHRGSAQFRVKTGPQSCRTVQENVRAEGKTNEPKIPSMSNKIERFKSHSGPLRSYERDGCCGSTTFCQLSSTGRKRFVSQRQSTAVRPPPGKRHCF